MPPEEQFDRLLRQLTYKLPSWSVWLTLDQDGTLKGWELEPIWNGTNRKWQHSFDDLPSKSGVVASVLAVDIGQQGLMHSVHCKVLAEPYRFAQKQKARSAAQQPLPDITNMLPPDYPDAWL